MPKIIDHDERRDQIGAAVLRVAASQGLKGVTMREVANEAGWSTGVLHHYFEQKHGLLVGGLRVAARSVGKRMRKAMRHKNTRTRLKRLIEEGMPLDEEREILCRIFFYFWAESTTDPEISGELGRYYDWWHDKIWRTLEEGQREGWVRKDVDKKMLAEALIGLADGIALKAKFNANSKSNKRLRQHVEMWIGLISIDS